MEINVKTNIDQVIRDLDKKFRSQIPFAAAKALTKTAKDVQAKLTAEIEGVFDRPVPFTQKAIGITYANKSTLTSRVFIKDVQAAYLHLQVAGGTRKPAGRALLIPAGVALNQYGNIPKGKVKALLGRKDVFSGRVRGVAGIWQRTGKGAKLLIAYAPEARYEKRFDFVGIARREIERTITANFREALQEALASAR